MCIEREACLLTWLYHMPDRVIDWDIIFSLQYVFIMLY